MIKKLAFSMRNKIQQKHFDFVVCNKDTMSIVCCIELNDSSHAKKSRSNRDDFVRGVCKAAGVELIEFKALYSYIAEDVRLKLEAAIGAR